MAACIVFIRETAPGERRVALTPETTRKLTGLGARVLIERGAGEPAFFPDAAYAGAEFSDDADAALAQADVLVCVQPPSNDRLARLKPGAVVIGLLAPHADPARVQAFVDGKLTAFPLEKLPRTTRAQAMDVLSSQAGMAGYKAVLLAAQLAPRYFPMLTTAAGTIRPSKVLVVGAGVAGLAAIGTSTSLGAITYAFDVRPEVAEQIESMGAQFVYLEFDASELPDGAATGGYAAPSTPEFQAKQLAKFRELAPDIDIVITTALIPGRPAPKLWTRDMVEMMKPGSVVVDLAAERGGNCDLTVMDQKVVSDNGVTIIGYTDFPSRMAAQASTLYSNNIRHMLTDLTPGKDGVINHNMEDDVIRGATVTHAGEITFPPPPPKIAAIAAAKPKERAKELTAEEKRAKEVAAFKAQTRSQVSMLVGAGLVLALVGGFAPASFMSHFIVFVLACFIGFSVIWNVSHSLHTPLMAVTNAISGIVVLGALLQVVRRG